jgi:hypothetical protein
VDVARSGTYTYEGHGISESGSLDGVTVDSDRGYRVIEARGARGVQKLDLADLKR